MMGKLFSTAIFIVFAAAAGVGGVMAVGKFSGPIYWRQLQPAAAVLFQDKLPRSSLLGKSEDDPFWREDIEPVTGQVTIALAGDIMLDRGVRQLVETVGGGDWDFPFDNAGFLRAADVVFGNLEGPISDRGEDGGSPYSFRMPPPSAAALARAGFTTLSVANNHSGDFGAVGFVDTLKYLAENGILAVGGGQNRGEAITPSVVIKNGFSVGFLGFTDIAPGRLVVGDRTPGVLLASDNSFGGIIQAAAGRVDVLVVSLHFGEEYASTASERQKSLARLAIDSGALIVAGHHPHVVQETEIYGDGFIAYSLGNFVFDQNFSPETMSGLVAVVTVGRQGISRVDLKKTEQDNLFRPGLLTQ